MNLEFKTPEEFYENFIKKRFIPSITVSPLSVWDDLDIKQSKAVEEEKVSNIEEYYDVTVKDKFGKSHHIDSMLRDFFKGVILETPTKRKETELAFLFRQDLRFNDRDITFTIDRPEKRWNPRGFITITRGSAKQNPRTKAEPAKRWRLIITLKRV